MDQIRARGFVGTETLEFWEVGDNVLALTGEIACRGLIVVRVEKYLDVLEGEGWNAYVQTFEYSYNAHVRGLNNILRYDNTHIYPGHEDAHHKHEYDWRTGEELPGSPTWVGVNFWPTLGEVLEELEWWYWDNRNSLPQPDVFPQLETRG